MKQIIHCPCGYDVQADSEDELVSLAQQHAKELHDMDLSREDALAMASPE